MKLMTFSSIVIFITMMFSSAMFAKTINLYDQPKPDAKIIGSIDSEKGLIPIFTPKDSQWIKIADPQNGNVGWAKSGELKVDGSKGYTFSEHVISNGNGPQSFIVKFSEPKPLTDAQMKEYAKKMQEKQQALQKDMQRMMQDMFTEFNAISTHFPVIMPIVVAPVVEQQNKTMPKTTAPDKK